MTQIALPLFSLPNEVILLLKLEIRNKISLWLVLDSWIILVIILIIIIPPFFYQPPPSTVADRLR